MKPERVEYPSAEVALIAYLPGALNDAFGLTDVDAGLERKQDSAELYVRVSRTGGVVINLAIDKPIITFECWAPTWIEAHDLAYATRAVVQQLYGTSIGPANVSWSSEVGGPVEFPHPSIDTPRYQHSQELTVHAVVE